MQKFRRVLSIALVFAMALALGAGAFTDDAAIGNTRAVKTMAALGIIKGYTDGSFRPGNIVTRAEMAKMIYVLKNGGKDDGAAYYKGITTGLPDAAGHWAEGYVNYCYTLGIIAGNKSGYFEPDRGVTGLEAAKMILVVAGFDAQKAGLVGAQWNVNTAALGAENGLFADFNSNLSEGSPRQAAAQLFYNALDAQMVSFVDGAYVGQTDTQGKPVTLGSKFLSLKSHTGILLSSKEENGKGKMTVEGFKAFDWNEDLTGMIGEEVRVLYKDGKDGGVDVYGLYATDSNTVLDAVRAGVKYDAAKDRLSIKDTLYRFDKNALIYVDGELLTKGTGNAAAPVAFKDYFDGAADASKVRLIDNDGDDSFDMARVSTFELARVNFVSSSGFRTESGTFSQFTEFDDEDVSVYAGIRKDDHVLITRSLYNGVYTVAKADTLTGKAASLRSGEVKIGDNWYRFAKGASIEAGNTYTFVLVGGIVYKASSGEDADAADLAVVIATEKVFGGDYRARMLFSDGTDKVVDAGDSVAALSGTPAFVTYETDSDGLYQFTEVSDGNPAGFDDYVTVALGGSKVFDSGKDLLGAYGVTDDAIIFLAAGGKYEVVTGKSLKSIAGFFGVSAKALRNTDGFGDIEAALIVSDEEFPGEAGEEVFGFVLDKNYTFRDGSKYYDNLTVWTAEGEMEINADRNAANEKDLIVFRPLADDRVTGLKVLTSEAVAILAYNEAGGRISVGGANKNMDEDAVILFVDSEELTGAANGEIIPADKPGSSYTNNARIVYADAEKTTVLYVVFDVSNKWAD